MNSKIRVMKYCNSNVIKIKYLFIIESTSRYKIRYNIYVRLTILLIVKSFNRLCVAHNSIQMMQDYESSCLWMWLQRKLGRPVRLPEHIPISAECLLNVAVMFTIYEMEPTLLCFVCGIIAVCQNFQHCKITKRIRKLLFLSRLDRISILFISVVYLLKSLQITKQCNSF